MQQERTSSVNAMLTRLNWEPLASRWHDARLLMFYKIHYALVTTPMPSDIKLHPVPTRVENSMAYHIPPSSCDYHLYSSPPRTVRDWNILPEAVVRASSPEVFRGMVHGQPSLYSGTPPTTGVGSCALTMRSHFSVSVALVA